MTRRLIIRVIVFVLLGAIVNVAMAWTLAATLPSNFIEDMDPEEHFTIRLSNAPATWLLGSARIRPGISKWMVEWINEDQLEYRTYVLLQEERTSKPLPRWLGDEVGSLIGRETRSNDVIVDARGWPRVAVYSVGDLDADCVLKGIPIASQADSARKWFMNEFALPTAPIWPASRSTRSSTPRSCGCFSPPPDSFDAASAASGGDASTAATTCAGIVRGRGPIQPSAPSAGG